MRKIILSLVVAQTLFSSCGKQDDILREDPMGFLSPNNSFKDKAGFESAIAHLYTMARSTRTVERWTAEGDKKSTVLYGSGTDLGYYWDKKLFYGDYAIVNPTDGVALDLWNILFGMVKDCNVIITRIEGSTLLTNDKPPILAQARFFRAYAYRYLVHLFGDVPKIDKEITAPKFDYIRVSRNEIMDFMIEDLEYANKQLPAVNPGNGRLSRAAADQLLTETYIARGNSDKAIEASSRIINDAQYKLITSRFGGHVNRPGDFFWDLFRVGNQNKSSGNTETILAWQMEFGVLGGEARYTFEREWAPFIEPLTDIDGKKAILPHDSLGRGNSFFVPNNYLEFQIWNSDFNNDIRNSAYNMQRIFYNNNPDSREFGKPITAKPQWLLRNYHVWIKKASSPEGHPQGYDTQGRLFTDIYAMRLAETYLLRAEAYLLKGDKAKAAEDINVVRARAKAKPVLAADATIDYLLDERARELCGEEPRRLTLARMGKLYERVVRYNPVSASTIKAFHNFLPIPQTAIDANTGTVLKQNEGY